jgi:hypothetical protein
MNCAKRGLALTDILCSPKVKNCRLALGGFGLQWLSAALGTSDDTRQNVGRDRNTVGGEIRVRETQNAENQNDEFHLYHLFTPQGSSALPLFHRFIF